METERKTLRVYLELETIKDKDSYFRVKRPDTHYVRIIIETKNLNVIVKELTFFNKKEATKYYQTTCELLGF